MMVQHPPSSATPPPTPLLLPFGCTLLFIYRFCATLKLGKKFTIFSSLKILVATCVWSGVNREIHFLPFSLHHQTLNFHLTLPPSVCQSVCLPCLPACLPPVVSQQNLGRTQCCKHRETQRETKTTPHTKKHSCIKTPYQSFSFPQNQDPSFRGRRRRRVRFLEKIPFLEERVFLQTSQFY
jgi:hypothetical protein